MREKLWAMKDEFVILHIDKQPENTSVFEKRFQRNYRIIGASSGSHAFNILKQEVVQLVIVDIEIPDMSAFDFLGRVKEEYPSIKRILLTSSNKSESAKKVVNEIGVYWYFSKPVDFNQMSQVLQNAEAAVYADGNKLTKENFSASFGNSLKVIGERLDETNLEKAENKLHEIEGQFQNLFELLPDATFIHNFKTITHVNKAFLRLFGYENKEDIIGKPALESVVFADDYPLVKSARKRFKKENSVFLPKIRHVRQDGSVFHTETHISQVTVGGIPHLQIISRDITNREKLEKELRQNEEKFRGIFESMVDVFIRVSNDGIVEMISQSAKMLGYSREDVLEKSVFDFYVNPEDRAAYIKRITETGSYNHFETQIYTKDGSILDISSNGKLYKDRNGKWGIESVFRDITAYKQQQKQLANSELKLRKFFDMAPVGIAINNMKGEFIDVNHEFSRFTGYTVKELNKLSYWELTPEKYAPQEQEQLNSMAERNAYGPYEKEYIHKKGHFYPVLLNGIKITDQNGDEFIWSVVQDISKAKEAEAELVEGKKVIEEQSERLKEAQQLAHLGSWEWDLQKDHVLWSEELHRIFGTKNHDEKRTLKSFLTYVNPDDRERVWRIIHDVLNNKGNADFEFRMIGEPGKERMLQSWSSMKLDDNGEPVKIVGAVMDITELTEQKKALHKSEQKLASINENSPDLVTTINRDLNVTYINKVLAGFSYQDVIGSSVLNYVPETEHEKYKNHLSEAFKGKKQEFEIEAYGENGRLAHYTVRASSFSGTSRVETLLITSTDITKRKRVEKALKKSEEQFRDIVQSTNDLIQSVNGEGHLIFVNRSWLSTLGYSWEEVIGKSVFDFIHPNDKGHCVALFQEISLNKTRTVSDEIHFISKSGKMIITEADINSTFKNDKLKLTRGVFRDITERKLSREMLDALSGVQTKFIQEDNAKKSFNALLDVLLEVTNSQYGFIGEVLYDENNSPYLKAFAITDISWNEETSAFYEANVPRGFEFRNLHTLFGRVLTTGKPVISNDPSNDPRRGGLPKGHPYMGSFLGLPFYNNNKMIGMVGIANRPEGYDDEIIKRLEPILATGSTLILANQNVVKRQRAEKELRRLNENLEDRVQRRTQELENAKQELAESLEKEKELNELKSRFVSMASHQFRTPLTVIQSSVNIMEMQTEEMGQKFKSSFVKSKNRINEQIGRMTTLMDDVLVLGKVNAQSIKYKPESIDLEEACSSIVNRFNGIQKDGRKITLSIVGTPRKVFLDPSLFDHSISNIVSNALKYSANKKSPEIIIRFGAQNTHIDVVDYGVGIPEKELFQLYEPFHRASNTKDVPGTGLGMSIAKEYIELNKGTIAVESEVGKGTKISVLFKELISAIK